MLYRWVIIITEDECLLQIQLRERKGRGSFVHTCSGEQISSRSTPLRLHAFAPCVRKYPAECLGPHRLFTAVVAQPDLHWDEWLGVGYETEVKTVTWHFDDKTDTTYRSLAFDGQLPSEWLRALYFIYSKPGDSGLRHCRHNIKSIVVWKAVGVIHERRRRGSTNKRHSSIVIPEAGVVVGFRCGEIQISCCG